MNKSHLVRVIAAIVDERQLTLYKENGETLKILQGDPRLAQIIQHITPILAEGAGAVAEVDLGVEPQDDNSYRHYEQQSEGKISFFKIAKSRLSGWLSKAAQALEAPTYVSPQVLGLPPQLAQKSEPKEETTKTEKVLSVVAEIMAHAQPVAHPEFHDRDTGDKGENTIVAVVGDKVVADIEKLKPQLKNAVATASTKGMDVFMQRCAAVADKRRHSVEDLLKFLEKGDLPIADDGSIIIYKALNRVAGGYVDCHTGNVKQRVGSYVTMDANMVDPSRNQDCSNGLHVARRSYLRNFSGDVIVLAKVNPEDVIAVPEYDASKMRVCGYHILFEVSNEAFLKLKSNQAFTETEEAQIQLGRALVGDHPEPIEEVKITQQYGGGIKVIPWVTLKPALVPIEAVAEPQPVPVKPPVKAAKVISEEVKTKILAPKVDPKAVVKAITKAKTEVETRKQKAERLHTVFILASVKADKYNAAKALIEFKKTAKVGWETLGLKPDTGERLQFILNKNKE